RSVLPSLDRRTKALLADRVMPRSSPAFRNFTRLPVPARKSRRSSALNRRTIPQKPARSDSAIHPSPATRILLTSCLPPLAIPAHAELLKFVEETPPVTLHNLLQFVASF